MRAFVGQIDERGHRRLTPEDHLPAEELARLARAPVSLVWAVLDEEDAEALCAEVAAGCARDACDRLQDRAVELLPLWATRPGPGSPA
jgi:hypothetical protein